MELTELWTGLGWPLLRLLFFISLGLIIGNLIEALNWTHGVAKFASPLVRLGRLKDISGASFTLAFFSPVAANTMLAERLESGEITRKELIISNLFNAMPIYFMHLPTMFFLTVPFIGHAAFIYVGLTFGSACLRTAAIVLAGRLLLPPLPEGCVVCRLEEGRTKGFAEALRKAWKRFKRRIPRILYITVPIYIAVYFLNRYGAFEAVEVFVKNNAGLLGWLHPKTVSIVVLQAAAQFSAGLAAAGALLESGAISIKNLVMALLVGNILSSPMRAVRQQFPYYAGIFNPRLALRLIVASQTMRVGSLLIVTIGYAIFA